MANSLRIYKNGMDSDTVPFVVVSTALLAVVFLAMFITCAVVNASPLMFIPLAGIFLLGATNVVLHNTSMYRNLEHDVKYAVSEYRKLPKDVRDSLGFTDVDIAKLPNNNAYEVRQKLLKLSNDVQTNQRVKNQGSEAKILDSIDSYRKGLAIDTDTYKQLG